MRRIVAASCTVIDVEQRDMSPQGVQLVGVLDHADGVLWSASLDEPDQIRDYRTVDGHPGRMCTDGLSGTWTRGSARRSLTTRGHTATISAALGHTSAFAPELFRAPLPTEEEVRTLLDVSSL